jgi:hypothetical protein
MALPQTRQLKPVFVLNVIKWSSIFIGEVQLNSVSLYDLVDAIG